MRIYISQSSACFKSGFESSPTARKWNGAPQQPRSGRALLSRAARQSFAAIRAKAFPKWTADASGRSHRINRDGTRLRCSGKFFRHQISTTDRSPATQCHPGEEYEPNDLERAQCIDSKHSPTLDFGVRRGTSPVRAPIRRVTSEAVSSFEQSSTTSIWICSGPGSCCRTSSTFPPIIRSRIVRRNHYGPDGAAVVEPAIRGLPEV